MLVAELPTSERAVIEVDIDLQSVIAKVQRSGDITKKEARDIERELKRAYRDAAKASEDAARQAARAHSKAARDALREQRRVTREMERSYAEQASAVRGLFSAALGGVGGDLLDLQDSLGGVSLAMGAVGVSLAALAIGPVVISEMAQAAYGAADAALEARDSLIEQGLAVEALVSPADLERLDAYEQAQADLAVSADMAAVVLGSALAPALTEITDQLIDLTPAAERALGGIDLALGGVESAGEFARDAARVGSLGLADLVFNAVDAYEATLDLEGEQRRLAIAAAQAEAEERQMLNTLGMLVTESEQLAITTARLTREHREEAQAAADAARAHREAQREQKAAAEKAAELERAVQAATASMADLGENIDTSLTVAELGRVQEAARAAAATIESMDRGPDGGAPLAALLEELPRVADAALAVAGAISPILGNLAQLQRAEQRQHEDRVQQLRDQRALSREVYRDALADYEDSREGMTEAERAAQEDYLQRLKQSEAAKRAQIRELEKEEQRAARQAFRRQQDLQVGQAVIDAARNAVVLTGSMAYLGPFAPAAAASIAGAQLATQIAVIKSQEPPKFHFGTSAAAASQGRGPLDIAGRAFNTRLEEGEGVVSRRGMATPGARDIVEALNRGLQPLASPAVHIGDAQADQLTARQNRPYAPGIRGRAMAGTNTFYRGR